MTDRELLQQALDALEDVSDDAEEPHKTKDAIEAIRTRLAQPDQEFCDPSYKIYKVVEMILSDCGISSNNQMLLDRVAKRIETYLTKQPEPEPVAWFMEGTFMDGKPSFIQIAETDPEFYTPLYTTPPKKEWVSLTDDERIEISWGTDTNLQYAIAIEAKLKEKNGG